MIVGTLGATLLGNLSIGKGTVIAGEGVIKVSQGLGTIRIVEGTIRAAQDF